MIPTSVKISPCEQRVIKDQVFTYLHGVQFQKKGEIARFAKVLFKLSEWLRDGETTATITPRLMQNRKIATAIKDGVVKQIESLCEMYLEPQLWIQRGKFKEFQQAIREGICESAHSYIELSAPAKAQLIKEQRLAKEQSLIQRRELQKATSSKRAKVSTITESQQCEEDVLIRYIDDLRLRHLRALELPLIEDQSALRALMERIPSFYCDFPNYLLGNKCALLWAIELGQCNVDHLPVEMQSDEEIQRAHARWKQQVLTTVRKYFDKECPSSDLASVERALSFSHLTFDLNLSVEILSMMMPLKEVCQIVRATTYYHSRDRRDYKTWEMPKLYAEVFHARMMLSGMFKLPEVQQMAQTMFLDDLEFVDEAIEEHVVALMDFANAP